MGLLEAKRENILYFALNSSFIIYMLKHGHSFFYCETVQYFVGLNKFFFIKLLVFFVPNGQFIFKLISRLWHFFLCFFFWRRLWHFYIHHMSKFWKSIMSNPFMSILCSWHVMDISQLCSPWTQKWNGRFVRTKTPVYFLMTKIKINYNFLNEKLVLTSFCFILLFFFFLFSFSKKPKLNILTSNTISPITRRTKGEWNNYRVNRIRNKRKTIGNED